MRAFVAEEDLPKHPFIVIYHSGTDFFVDFLAAIPLDFLLESAGASLESRSWSR